MAGTVKFKFEYKGKDRPVEWPWQDYMALAYILHNPDETKMINSGDYNMQFIGKSVIKLSSTKRTKFGAAEEDVRVQLSFFQNIEYLSLSSNNYPSLCEAILRSNIANDNLVYAEQHNDFIYIACKKSVLKKINRFIDDSFSSSLQKNKENSIPTGCSGINTNLEKSSSDASSKRAVCRQCWKLDRNCKIVLLQEEVGKIDAGTVIEMYETHKINIELKWKKKKDNYTVQFPVPCHSGQNAPSDLGGNIEKVLSKVKSGPVVLDLDKLEKWPVDSFLQVLLERVYTHTQQLKKEDGGDGLEIILCAKNPEVYDILNEQIQVDRTRMHKSVPDAGLKPKHKKVRIEVKCGTIENMEADGLVCTMPLDLNLYKAGASSALSVAAGRGLQEELNKKHLYPNQLEYGEVAVVGGHKLKCQYVFLGVMNRYEPKYDENKEGPDRYHAVTVYHFMTQCLQKADELGLTSLAFPAVGCGNLKFPVDIVAEEMFRAVNDHGDNYPTSQIKQVKFVIFPEDEEAILEKEKRLFLTSRWNGVCEDNPEHKKATDQTQNRENKEDEVDQPGAEFNKHKRDDNSPKESKRIKTSHNSAAHADHPNGSDDEGKLCLPKNLSMTVTEFFMSKMFGKYSKEGFKFTFGSGYLKYEGLQHLTTGFRTEFKSARSKLENEIATDSLDIKEIKDEIDVKGKEYEGEGVFLEHDSETKVVKFYGKTWEDIQRVRQKFKIKYFPDDTRTRGDRNLVRSTSNEQTDSSDIGAQSKGASNGGARPKNGKSAEHGGGASESNFSWSLKTSNVKVYTVEKVIVKVYCADILEVPVDCIVNAANSQLHHKGGVAKYIAKAAGPRLKKESEDIIKKRGPLQVGEACSTTAGDLPYHYVIHTVGPCWSWYTPHDLAKVQKCECDLKMAIKNSLSKAEKLGQSSIAIPAVSAGQFGCPEELCAVQYARAVLAYSQLSKEPIQEVHFIDKNDAMVKEMHRVFKEVHKGGGIFAHYNSQNFVMSPASSKNTQAKDKESVAASKSSNHLVSSVSGDARWSTTYTDSYNNQYPNCMPEKTVPAAGQIFTCFFSQNQKLLVYREDILLLDNIDMIACTESITGTSNGYIAQQLKYWGGSTYSKEKDRSFKHKQRGDVVVCGAGDNKFKHVAHAILYYTQDIKGEEDRRIKVNSIFNKLWEAMVRLKYQSLALPLLGTGSGNADPVFYTQRLFESLHVFCSKPANKSKVIQIHLVNNEQNKTNTAVGTIQEQVRAVKTMPAAHRQAPARPKSAAPGVNRGQRASQDNSGFHRTTDHGHHRNKKKESNRTGKFSARDSYESDSDEEDEGGFSRSRHGKDIENSGESEFTMAAAARSQTSKKGNLPVFDDDKDDTDPVQDVQEGISNMSLSKRDKNNEKADRDRESSRPSTFEAADGDDCVICMDTMKQPKTLPCGHKFCTGCIEAQFQYKEVCPTCGAVCGMITGDQPDGKMEYYVSSHSHCAGYEDCGRIQITYSFSNGEQQSHHPSPGKWYKGIRRSGYLPDNKQGREVLEMLKVAFDRKLVFTIGNSRTTGQQGVITWNDIHHKTDPQPHTPFGYPDPTYLDRVVDELKAKGVTTADIPRGSFSRSTRSTRL